MIAESAVMGLRITLVGSVRSIITTRFCSPVVSRTQMKRSDSSVRVLKPILAALTPKFWSYHYIITCPTESQNKSTKSKE